MARRRKNKVIEELRIESMATEGKGMGRHNGKVVFVEGTVPGDVAKVLIQRNKKDYSTARVLDLLQASDQRIEAFCQHFGDCGGCKWQFLEYAQQLAYKQGIVEEAFRRIGKLEFPEPFPILGCAEPTFYRNKMEYTFSNKRWITQEEVDAGGEIDSRHGLGFHIRGHFDKIVDIHKCYLQDDYGNAIRNAVRKHALANDLSFYNISEHGGLLRNLIIRNSSLGEWMVIVSMGEDQPANRQGLLDMLVADFPEITSLHYVVNQKKNDTLFDQDIICYHGRGHIFESFEGIKYKISPKSFFQTNPAQGLKLYEITRAFADLQKEDIVYDLYTGTGSIALFVAEHCAKVFGIEEVEMAIEDAKFNAALNGIDNAQFFAGDVKQVWTDEFVAEHGRPDVLITDPPRAGMHADVVAMIMKLRPSKIVYVSCNPVTQARDLQLMQDSYKIEKIQPVDMFPQTPHIENVVLLQRR